MNAAVRNMTEPMMTTIAGNLFIGKAPLSYRLAVLLADHQITGEGKSGESQDNKTQARYDGFATNHFRAQRVSAMHQCGVVRRITWALPTLALSFPQGWQAGRRGNSARAR